MRQAAITNDQIKSILLDQFNFLNSKKSNWIEGLDGFIKNAKGVRKAWLTSINNDRSAVTKAAKTLTPGAWTFNQKMYPLKRKKMSNKPKGNKISERIKSGVNRFKKNTGVTITSGSDATKGYVPIVLTIGAVLFFVFSFGKLKSK